jgi:hypothetical protein
MPLPVITTKAAGGESWFSWRLLLLAAMGEELTEEERRDFTELTLRPEPPHEPCREFYGIIGRRGGKSRSIATLAACVDRINAVAGALIYADLKAAYASSLSGLLGPNHQPVEIHQDGRYGQIFASCAADETGRIAAVYIAWRGCELILADFDVCPFLEFDADAAQARIREIFNAIPRNKDPRTGMYASAGAASLLPGRVFGGEGVPMSGVIPFPFLTTENDPLVRVAAPARAGLRIARPAWEKAQRTPLGYALDFRLGKRLGEDCLYDAVLFGAATTVTSDGSWKRGGVDLSLLKQFEATLPGARPPNANLSGANASNACSSNANLRNGRQWESRINAERMMPKPIDLTGHATEADWSLAFVTAAESISMTSDFVTLSASATARRSLSGTDP